MKKEETETKSSVWDKKMPKVTQVLEQSSGTRQVCSIGLVTFLVIVYSYFKKVCREKCTRQS